MHANIPFSGNLACSFDVGKQLKKKQYTSCMDDRIAICEQKIKSIEDQIQSLKNELTMIRGKVKTVEDGKCRYCLQSKNKCKCEECFGCHGVNTCNCGSSFPDWGFH